MVVLPSRTRVLIVDSRALLRAGLRSVLAAERGVEVVAEATSGAQAVALAREYRPQVVLLEAHLPDQDSADTCRQLQALTPRPAVAVLTDVTDEVSVRAWVRAGAQGYLLEDVSADNLRRDLRALARGERVFDPRVASLLVLNVRPAEADVSPDALLSGRRRAILRLVAEGLSNREIAQRTHLSELTVKGYVEEILDLLGARNRVQAAVLAIRRRLI